MRNLLQLFAATLALAGGIPLSAEPAATGVEASQRAATEQAVKLVDPDGREYFPDDFDCWYRKHLFAMGEPSLFSSESAGNEQVRFLCLPTFSKPICFRAFKKEGRFFIRAVRLTGQGGYEPGRIELDSNIEITKEEWAALFQAVTKSTQECKLTSDQQSILAGLDGTKWILEARINGKYYFQDVWGPDYWTSPDGVKALEKLNEGLSGEYKLDDLNIAPFRDACSQFLLLTDFTVPSRMVPAELQSEQGGADQPATAPQLKSDGKDKPQPESKVGPR